MYLSGAITLSKLVECVTAVFHREAAENRAPLGYYAASSGNLFQCMSNKMQLHAVYLCLETALHVSGVTSTHHQERIQLYLQHLLFVTPLLLPAAIVEEMELV